jgi:hypothetical protein
MGKRTIIMVPIMEYYTWVEGNSSSSWYGDKLTLIRQQKPEQWDEAYAELKSILECK